MAYEYVPLSGNPEDDEQRFAPASPLNPIPEIVSTVPLGPAGPERETTFNPLTHLFRLGGQADVNMGIKTPEDAEARAKAYSNFARDFALSLVGNKAIPAMSGWEMLARPAVQGAIAGGTGLAEGRSQREIVPNVAAAIFGQGAGELMSAPVRAITTQMVGNKALADFEAAQQAAKKTNEAADLAYEVEKGRVTSANKAYEDLYKTEKGRVAEDNMLTRMANQEARSQWRTAANAVRQENTAAQSAFEQAKILHSEQAAMKLVDYLKEHVPEAREFPSGTRGLADFVYGKGQDLLSKGYDDAMKDVLARAEGISLNLSPETAARFGIKASASGFTPDQVDVLRRLGVTDPTEMAALGKKMGFEGVAAGYDAPTAIKAILGKWKKDPEGYREVVDAIADKGLTNERAESYKQAQGVISYINKTRALDPASLADPNERLNVDKILAGFTDLADVNELRRRQIGNIYEGPFQAARGGPLAPTARPLPDRPAMRTPAGIPPQPPTPESLPTKPIPVSVTPPDVEMRKIPEWWRLSAGAGAGSAIGGAAGHAVGMGPLGAALGAMGGGIAGHTTLPLQMIRRAPLTREQEELLRLLPIFSGALGSAGFRYGR